MLESFLGHSIVGDSLAATISVGVQSVNIFSLFSHVYPFSLIFIGMGRKRKYVTDEEKAAAVRERATRYYWKNVKKVRAKNLRRYYDRKGERDL